MNTLRRTLPVLLSFLLAFSSFPMAADPVTATLEGTVTDTNGQALPGVSIEVKSPTLVGVRVVVTDVNGRFSFLALPIGTYNLKLSLSGFERIERSIALGEKGRTLSLTMRANAGTSESSIVAVGEQISEITQTSTTNSSGLVQKLPAGRNLQELSKASTGDSKQPRRVSGFQAYDNKFQVGGVQTKTPTESSKTSASPTYAGHSAAIRPKEGTFRYSRYPYPTDSVNPPSPPGPAFAPIPVLNSKPFPDMFFKSFGVNPTVETEEEAVSTFSASVDTAAYTLARSYLSRGAMPEPAGVRVEEFVNFFDYGYEPPRDGEPFSVHAEAFPSPNRKGYHVLHLGLKGRTVDAEDRKPATLVFCIDVSGSMDIENRLGLVKRALRLLVNELDERDRVGIVVYGTNARVLLEPVNASEKNPLLASIEQLHAEGSTNAQAGIREAYKMAARHLRPRETNRIVLCTDGVANNGVTDADQIFSEIKSEADRGITITAVGFGMGNYNDVLLERLAQIGHGNYAYVDRLEEARRIFVTELSGTLQTIAKDVKIQVEFDPAAVSRYRLLGFESRPLTKEEFVNDRVDAGNIGAGHAVTALYEVKLKGRPASLGTLRIRYKDPEGSRSRLLAKNLSRSILKTSVESASSPARLSFLAASFAEKLRGSYWVRNLSYDQILSVFDGLNERMAGRADVAELKTMVAAARSLDRRGDQFEAIAPIAKMDFDHVPVLR